jgi:adenine-specific DNA-methyltransferase
MELGSGEKARRDTGHPEGEVGGVSSRLTRCHEAAALDAWFRKQDYNTKDQEFDIIYVNGDNNLENLR